MNVFPEVNQFQDVDLLKISPYKKCKALGSIYVLIIITQISCENDNINPH